MCLKDDIKFAQNSMNITLSSINDENPDTKDKDISNFTITLPTHPNTKNYKQALVQVQSLHCPPLSVNPSHDVNVEHDVNSSSFGVEVGGLGVMNSYISGIPSNIVGVGAPMAAPVNQIERTTLEVDTHIRSQHSSVDDGGTEVTNTKTAPTGGVKKLEITAAGLIELHKQSGNYYKLGLSWQPYKSRSR